MEITVKKKPILVKMTVTYTFYGVGKTQEDAERNAYNEYEDAMFQRNTDGAIEYEQVDDIYATSLSQEYVDFIMDDDFEEME